MKPEDRRLRSALVGVLDAHGVDSWDVNTNGCPTLSFRLGTKTHRFAYTADDENKGIVRKLVNLLITNGYQQAEKIHAAGKVPPPSREVLQQAPDRQPEHPELADLDNEELVATVSSEDRPKIDAEPEIVDASSPENASSEEAELENASEGTAAVLPAGLMVYQPRPDHVPADVFVVVAVKDHLISVGDRVVIPVHRPDRMMVLSEEDFETRYMPHSFERPYIPKAPDDPPMRAPEPRKRREVRVREPDVATPPEPPWANGALSFDMFHPEEDEVAEEAVDPVVAVSASFPPQVRRPVAAPPINMAERTLPDPTPRDNEQTDEDADEGETPGEQVKRRTITPGGRISVDGFSVAAQLGRILAGIRQATIETDQKEVTAGEAASFMPPADRKQITSRIHPAVKCGWVKVRRADVGYLYGLTTVGDKAVRALASACYREVGLEVPPFIEALDHDGKVLVERKYAGRAG